MIASSCCVCHKFYERMFAVNDRLFYCWNHRELMVLRHKRPPNHFQAFAFIREINEYRGADLTGGKND